MGLREQRGRGGMALYNNDGNEKLTIIVLMVVIANNKL